MDGCYHRATPALGRCRCYAKARLRGNKPGSGRGLSFEQERGIAQTIWDTRHEQLKINFAQWSRPAVRQHIELSPGIKLSIRAVSGVTKYLGHPKVTFAAS